MGRRFSFDELDTGRIASIWAVYDILLQCTVRHVQCPIFFKLHLRRHGKDDARDCCCDRGDRKAARKKRWGKKEREKAEEVFEECGNLRSREVWIVMGMVTGRTMTTVEMPSCRCGVSL